MFVFVSFSYVRVKGYVYYVSFGRWVGKYISRYNLLINSLKISLKQKFSKDYKQNKRREIDLLLYGGQRCAPAQKVREILSSHFFFLPKR